MLARQHDMTKAIAKENQSGKIDWILKALEPNLKPIFIGPIEELQWPQARVECF